MKRLLCACLAVYLLGSAVSVHADAVRVCISDTPLPPVTFPDHDGQAQYLIRQAASEVGVSASFTALPWRRCLQDIQEGRQDAAVVGYNRTYEKFLVFPMQRGHVDTARQLAEGTVVVVRKVGVGAGWNGRRFAGVILPVLYGRGQATIMEELARHGVSGSDAGKSGPQMLNMLLLKRAQLALLLETEAKPLLSSPEFNGKLEMLPIPFLQISGYLGFGKGFYQAHPRLAEGLWAAIGRIRSSPGWESIAPTLAK